MKLLDLLENATTFDEEPFDTRFENVISLVDQEKLDDASRLIETIFKEGMIDIRLVMYYCYAQFISQGAISLQEIFPLLTKIVEEYWEKISPASQKEKYLAHSLTWLISSITKKLKRSEKKQDLFWKTSAESLNPDSMDELILTCHAFNDFCSQKINDVTLAQPLMFIEKWVQNVRPAEAPAEPPPLQEEKAPAPEAPTQSTLPISEPMQHLLQKLRAFETLTQQENFEKAALIADDISHTLKNFDPALFFPTLFSPYFALAATHMDALSQEWENRGSLKWEALQRLYQTDLAGFIEW